jgi:hypothetical protein
MGNRSDFEAFDPAHCWKLAAEPRVADIQEVRQLGARSSRARNSDRTAAAIFWDAPPVVVWTEAAHAVARAGKLDAARTANLVASVAAAIAEAHLLAAWLKHRIVRPRPEALIRGHAASRLARTDPNWESLLQTPDDSEAPATGCLAAGAAAGVLLGILPVDAIAICVTFPAERGLTRRFASLTAMLQESEDARIWAGLHLRATVVESTEIGLLLGERFRR